MTEAIDTVSESTPPETGEQLELPLLPVRNAVLFPLPSVWVPLLVRREKTLRAVQRASEGNGVIAVVAQKRPRERELRPGNLHDIGTEAIVGRVIRMPDGAANVWVQGQRRIRLVALVDHPEEYRARVEPVAEETAKDLRAEALMRAVLANFEQCVKLSPSLPDDAYVSAMNAESPGLLADIIAATLELDIPQRQEILSELDAVARLDKVSLILQRELEVLKLQDQIQNRVREEVEKGQREYFLREQMKAIRRELGETQGLASETEQLRERIAAAGMPEEVQKKALEELERLESMPQAAPEVSVVRTYLDWLVTLPWTTATADNLDLQRAHQVLDEDHHGLEKPKERILEYMAVRKLAQEGSRSPILCFVGPPGCGKTSLGRSIARALGRKFVRISLGGIRDEAEIRGHRRTYVAALPGRIIQTMRTAGTVNPVFMLDEIDKVGMDFRGDPSSALLEVLDPEQNHSFSDHYLDVPYDLSQVMFIATANLLEPILPALRDRLEVIELPGYVEEEKVQIARRFLIPRQLRENGLSPDRPRFTPAAVRRVIREYTHEAGVRNLERELGSICRKVAKRVAEGREPPKTVSGLSIPSYLGPQKYFWGVAEEEDAVGVSTGVARTEQGGDVLSVEVTLMAGKGQLTLTGQLGDVMRESAMAALSYARSRAEVLGLDPKLFSRTDIHVHVPQGAIPKDGPSAGITIATALVSALTQRPVRADVAMTGEITLRGRVLPVGGLREKILAAHRAGITTFVCPRRNQKDLAEVPSRVRRELDFVFVEHMDQVLKAALRSDGAAPPGGS